LSNCFDLLLLLCITPIQQLQVTTIDQSKRIYISATHIHKQIRGAWWHTGQSLCVCIVKQFGFQIRCKSAEILSKSTVTVYDHEFPTGVLTLMDFANNTSAIWRENFSGDCNMHASR